MGIQRFLLFLFFFIVTNEVFCQLDSASNIATISASERDLRDVFKHNSAAHKNAVENNEEPKPGKYLFSYVPALGYTLQTGFAGILSGNAAFYNGAAPDQKISSISTSFTYSQYEQSIVPLIINIWTKNNKINFITDCRFIQYPSDIYGLGVRGLILAPDSNANTGYTINFSGLKFHQTVMFSVAKNVYAGVGYFYDQFWNIEAIDSLRRNVARVLTNKLGTNELASGPTLRFLYDSRTNQINPDKGWYYNMVYRSSLKSLGSDANWSSLLVDMRTYTHFPENSKNILAFWGLGWTTMSKKSPPYLLLPSTGWDDQYNSGRGYIQGRYRGRDMFYIENEYRFGISRNGLLGGVVFANFQYFSSDLSKEFNNVKGGYGLGIRIKLNKYSGTNLAIDYGFGEKDSRGFFVNLGEVF